MSNTMIHASDEMQREAAEKIRQAVEVERNLKDQAAYWQNVAQNKISHQMQARHFGRNYPATDYREVYG